jgi:hypothetical protein
MIDISMHTLQSRVSKSLCKVHGRSGQRGIEKPEKSTRQSDLNEALTTRTIYLAGTLFLLTGYSGYLGWQWRSVRTIAQEIRYAARRRIRERRVGSG